MVIKKILTTHILIMAKTCLIVMIHGFVKTSKTKNDLRSKKHDQSSRSVAASLARTSTANLKE